MSLINRFFLFVGSLPIVKMCSSEVTVLVDTDFIFYYDWFVAHCEETAGKEHTKYKQ